MSEVDRNKKAPENRGLDDFEFNARS